MPMPSNDLHTRLNVIRAVLPIDKIISRNAEDIDQISRYYKKNRLAYLLFNSHKGFVHMGISEGDKFVKTDFYAQAKIISQLILDTGAKDVLELAAGKAATISYLSSQHPTVQFYGLDLPNGQFKTKTNRQNISLTFGDYHDLKIYKDKSLDIVYVIEALCHAHDKNKVIAEVNRVLRPDGLFIIIDGYFADTSQNITREEEIAVSLVTKSMMVTTNNQTYENTLALLAGNGFYVQTSINYSKNIMPSLQRLEATAAHFFKHPRAASFVNLVAGDIVTANAAAGYLMPICVDMGLFEYHYTLAKKQQ